MPEGLGGKNLRPDVPRGATGPGTNWAPAAFDGRANLSAGTVDSRPFEVFWRTPGGFVHQNK